MSNYMIRLPQGEENEALVGLMAKAAGANFHLVRSVQTDSMPLATALSALLGTLVEHSVDDLMTEPKKRKAPVIASAEVLPKCEFCSKPVSSQWSKICGDEACKKARNRKYYDQMKKGKEVNSDAVISGSVAEAVDDEQIEKMEEFESGLAGEAADQTDQMEEDNSTEPPF